MRPIVPGDLVTNVHQVYEPLMTLLASDRDLNMPVGRLSKTTLGIIVSVIPDRWEDVGRTSEALVLVSAGHVGWLGNEHLTMVER